MIQDLRSRIIQRTAGRGLQQRELLEIVFHEIDTDGSGEINRTEFESMLITMDMGYSGKKFMKLYNAIDRNGDGSLSLAELNHLLFPENAKQKDVKELGLKIQSHLDRRINAMENEHLAEADSVSHDVHQKRRGQISSLKSRLKSLNSASLEVSENVSPNASDVIIISEMKPQIHSSNILEEVSTINAPDENQLQALDPMVVPVSRSEVETCNIELRTIQDFHADHGNRNEISSTHGDARITPPSTSQIAQRSNFLTMTSSPLQATKEQMPSENLQRNLTTQPSNNLASSEFGESGIHSPTRRFDDYRRRLNSLESDDSELIPNRSMSSHSQSFRDWRCRGSSHSAFSSDDKSVRDSFSNI